MPATKYLEALQRYSYKIDSIQDKFIDISHDKDLPISSMRYVDITSPFVVPYIVKPSIVKKQLK